MPALCGNTGVVGEDSLQPVVITAASFGQGTLGMAENLHLSGMTALPTTLGRPGDTHVDERKPASFRPEIDIGGIVTERARRAGRCCGPPTPR